MHVMPKVQSEARACCLQFPPEKHAENSGANEHMQMPPILRDLSSHLKTVQGVDDCSFDDNQFDSLEAPCLSAGLRLARCLP